MHTHKEIQKMLHDVPQNNWFMINNDPNINLYSSPQFT